MQGMWVIHVVTYTSSLEGTQESPFTNIITSNTIMKCLNASLSNITSSRNVAANLIASLKKCYIRAQTLFFALGALMRPGASF